MENNKKEKFIEENWFPTSFNFGFYINNKKVFEGVSVWPGRLFWVLDAFWENKTQPSSYSLVDCAKYCVENNLKEGDKLYDIVVCMPDMKPEYLKDLASISTIPIYSCESWNWIVMQVNTPDLYIDIYTMMQEMSDNLSVFDDIFMMDYKGWTYSMKIDFESGKITLIQASFYDKNNIKNFSYNYTFVSNSHFKRCIDIFDKEAIDKDCFDILGFGLGLA